MGRTSGRSGGPKLGVDRTVAAGTGAEAVRARHGRRRVAHWVRGPRGQGCMVGAFAGGKWGEDGDIRQGVRGGVLPGQHHDGVEPPR